MTLDPATIPSTVYRTLDVLEELGLIQHGHGAEAGRSSTCCPTRTTATSIARICGQTWELGAKEAASLVRSLLRTRGFEVDLTHMTMVGRCADCRAGAPA